MNKKKDIYNKIDPLDSYCGALLCEIQRYIIYQLTAMKDINFFTETGQQLDGIFSTEKTSLLFQECTTDFPPGEKKSTSDENKLYTFSTDDFRIVNLIILWISNINPGLSFVNEFFNDRDLREHTIFIPYIEELRKYFSKKTLSDGKDLFQILEEPIKAHPNSLRSQLEYIFEKWSFLLKDFQHLIDRAKDLIQEAEKDRGWGGPAPSYVHQFHELDDRENFSIDHNWMMNLILIAKNVFVWLSQLSNKYGYKIERLDQVPSRELDMLAGWGVTGLWLIGIWERSKASKKIKRWCGNPEAESSAYSVFAYDIAQNLGGEQALRNLKGRCIQRGIRLACDMVPNHMSIDSDWVMNHPDWFIYSPNKPYPSYSFSGVSLSENPSVGIFLEDHYFSQTDASVVFKYIDRNSGKVKYVYHGNDGTRMPWNDTAQLNYLLDEVREAVIRLILKVADLCSVIRFDAAMTLTKKHYQRLWYPQPGTGGDIPTRSWFGLSKDQFDSKMPDEFWRQVVERIGNEKPDTLLLAEAFWFTEGFFVRSLGMHRVYNSAFMNMLRDEENAKYRQTIKNTIQFNPEILKRYTNFMNNPDEKTAVEQFGKSDKYFGICVMLVTMPGLPMLGHGQIEGFAEKYGMEYKKAYYREYPDKELIAKHEKEIFPLMRKRYLFADVKNFRLYNFITNHGLNENVFAYSNSVPGEYALVLYNNAFPSVAGTIHSSVKFTKPQTDGSIPPSGILAENLGLRNNEKAYCIFQEQISRRWYIRENRDIRRNGLFFSLHGYEYLVFMNFYQVEDDETETYRNLMKFLSGKGTKSIQKAVKENKIQELNYLFEELLLANFLHPDVVKKISKDDFLYSKFKDSYHRCLKHYSNIFSIPLNENDELKLGIEKFEAVLNEFRNLKSIKTKDNFKSEKLFQLMTSDVPINFLEPGKDNKAYKALNNIFLLLMFEGLYYSNSSFQAFIQDLEPDGLRFKEFYILLGIINQFSIRKNILPEDVYIDVCRIFFSNKLQMLWGLNEYQGTVYLKKESFEDSMKYILNLLVLKELLRADFLSENIEEFLLSRLEIYVQIIKDVKLIAEKNSYKLESFIKQIKELSSQSS
jgi:hypothetical protein